MKKIVLLIGVLLLCQVSMAQYLTESQEAEILSAYENGYYDKVISLAQNAANKGDVFALELIAAAHYQKGNFKEAFNWFVQAANKGNVSAQVFLGECYIEGHKVQANASEGIKWLTKAADNGHVLSQFNVGGIYASGSFGIPKDMSKAKQYLQLAIDGGSVDAMGLMSEIYYEEGNSEKSKQLLEELVRYEKQQAPEILANRFYNRDDEKAFRLYRIAAENGNANAQYEFGRYFTEGKFVEQDFKSALIWFQRSAEQGHNRAQDELGECYKKLFYKTMNDKYLKQYVKWAYRAGQSLYRFEIDKDGNPVLIDPLVPFYEEGYLNANKYKSYEEWKEKVVKKIAEGSDVDRNIPQNQNTSNSYAVVIANESYEYEHYVSYAENDGDVVAKYFEYTLGIPSENIHLVKDAGLNNIKREIDWLIEESMSGGVENVYFYYIGHGMPANDLSTAYLLPVDGYAKNPETGLDLRWLYKKLGQINTNTYVFLDACFSGSGRHKQMLVASRTAALVPKETAPQNKTVVFTACQGVEMAYPYEEQEHGLFTYYFLKALQNSEGRITCGEMSDFVRTNVRTASKENQGAYQTPTIIVSADLNASWRNLKFIK